MWVAITGFAVCFSLIGGLVGWKLGKRSLQREYARALDTTEADTARDDPRITPAQRIIIEGLCAGLDRAVPERLDAFSEADAELLIEQWREDLSERQTAARHKERMAAKSRKVA